MKRSHILLLMTLVMLPTALMAQDTTAVATPDPTAVPEATSDATPTETVSPEAMFNLANQHYAEGRYQEAITLYETLLAEQAPAPELYLNMGNAYFRINDMAHSILYYQRALRIRPHYSDARHNLEIAQSRTVDNIDATNTNFMVRGTRSVVNMANSNTWTWLSIGLFIGCLGLFFLFAFGRRTALRKTGFYGAIVTLLLSVVCLLCATAQHRQETDHTQAIIMRTEINVKSSPDESGTDIFMLHAGTQVTVGEQIGDWYEIQLADDTKGWIHDGTFEII